MSEGAVRGWKEEKHFINDTFWLKHLLLSAAFFVRLQFSSWYICTRGNFLLLCRFPSDIFLSLFRFESELKGYLLENMRSFYSTIQLILKWQRERERKAFTSLSMRRAFHKFSKCFSLFLANKSKKIKELFFNDVYSQKKHFQKNYFNTPET